MRKANRDRSSAMLNQFSKCLYRRSNEKSLDLLAKSDLGFSTFEQIGTTAQKAMQNFGFQDCLGRVAEAHNSGVSLRFYAGGLRQWLLTEAYFDRFPDGAVWVKPGHAIADRVLPLSAENPAVVAWLDFADCIVANDPYNADYFFRVPAGSAEEKPALRKLIPTIGTCLPDGQQMEIQPVAMRIWLGEALWHAANNNAPAPAGPPQDPSQGE
jgi:hypothetical protein